MLICPHCRGAVADNPALDGQVIICPHCHNQFTQPVANPVPLAPLVPLVQGAPGGIHFRGGPKSFKRARTPQVNPVVAGMLSLLLPGLGQFAQGRGVEGTCFLIAALICLVAGCALGPLLFVPAVVVLVWSVIDAANH